MWDQGRPTKYHSGLPIELIRLMSQGYTNTWVCAQWDISEQTFYNWIKEYDDFRSAYEIGLPKCKVWWETVGKEMMDGTKDVNGFKPWIAFMNAKFRYSGADHTPVQHGNTININNMNVLNNTPAEVNKQLAQLMDKYGATNIDDLKALVYDGQTGQKETP